MSDGGEVWAGDFSVVMAVHAGDHPAFVKEAFESLQRQALQPAQILIVADGPLGSKLDELLSALDADERVRILRLPYNRGPGAARDAAIRAAAYDIVAVMDADDVCDPKRFEKQVPVILDQGVDLVGAWIEEFHVQPGDLGRTRKTPQTHEEIRCYGRWRQPVNNVTSVFRRSAYLAAGGYGYYRFVEDYDLIVRMLIKGFKLQNVPEVLVHVRSGGAYLHRRRGLRHLREELGLYHRMRRWRYLNTSQMCANMLLRIVMRLLPQRTFQYLYRAVLRHDPVTAIR